MGKLFYSENIACFMNNWENVDFLEIHAGRNTIAGVARDGSIYIKHLPEEMNSGGDPIPLFRRRTLAVRCQDEVLHTGSGRDDLPVAAVSKLTGDIAWSVGEKIYGSGWDIPASIPGIHGMRNYRSRRIQLAASDALFALYSDGIVSFMCSRNGSAVESYHDVRNWSRVTRLVTGSQCSVFGITDGGSILCTGYNCIRGPKGDVREKLRAQNDAVDVCSTGSECERILVAKKDGTIVDPFLDEMIFDGAFVPRYRGEKVLESWFNYLVYVLTKERRLEHIMGKAPDPAISLWRNVTSFAIGSFDYSEPFILAVCE